MIELKNINQDEDFEFYLRIIDNFQNHKGSEDELEISEYQAMNTAMKGLKYEDNKTAIKNALILIMALYRNISPDNYNSKGIEISKISKKEREEFAHILRKEIRTGYNTGDE